MTLTAPMTLPELRAWLADLQTASLARLAELHGKRCDPLRPWGCGVEHGAGSIDKTDSSDLADGGVMADLADGNDGKEAKL